jgi:hypothetical protein
MIALPVFGYKFGVIRSTAVTSASAADDRMLRQVIGWT